MAPSLIPCPKNKGAHLAGLKRLLTTHCSHWHLRYGRAMSAAYDELLKEVCVRFGFCGSVVDGRPLHVADLLPTSGLVSADSFANAIFVAEGCDPNGPTAQQHRETIRDAFVRHMGGAQVDARLLG